MKKGIFVETSGEGASSVALLHGSPCPPDELQPLAQALSRRYRVGLLHLPGYGRSTAWTDYSMGGVRQGLEVTLRDNGFERPHLVGYSAGALRAVDLVLNGGLDVQSLTLLAGLAVVSAEERAAASRFARLVRQGIDVSFVARARFLSPAMQRDPALFERVIRWVDAIAPEDLAEEMEGIAAVDDFSARLSAIRVPVRCRVGALDAATPPSHSQCIVDGVSDGVLEIVPDVGHALLLEDLAGTVAFIERAIQASGNAST